MSVTYSIDADQKIIRTRCVGKVTYQEVTDHLRTLACDSECPDRLDVLLDVREMSSLPEGTELWAFGHELSKLREKVKFEICAIVAPSDALFGMMRAFEVISQDYFHAICVFRVASAAEEWLETQRSLIDSDQSYRAQP